MIYFFKIYINIITYYRTFYNKIVILTRKGKWPEQESNQRHKDFQSFALPTELSGQLYAFIFR